MNRLLITGATGFLGVPCVARATADFEVHATARRCGRLAQFVTSHDCDLFDPTAVNALLAAVRPTHLLHLAWIATPGVYWTSPENHRWVEASEHLLTSFADHGGTRAVVTGTCAEYDWTGDGVCHESGTPTRPTTLYGQCKHELSEWLWRAGGVNPPVNSTGGFTPLARQISTAWARLFFLYGPREHPARLVPSVARALLAGEPAECSTGTQQRDFLHVDDVADALVTLLRSDLTGPINIGSGEAVAVRTVIETVARACGRPDLVRLGAKLTPANEPPLLVADVTRLRDELGWRPRVSLEAGIRECVNWWRLARAA